jgi:NADPH:quinone reductase-like Zn-dependent oxidoreductase
MSCGLNSAAVLLAHALGAHSVFTASGKERIARVTALGGTVGVDYREEDFLAAVTKGLQSLKRRFEQRSEKNLSRGAGGFISLVFR